MDELAQDADGFPTDKLVTRWRFAMFGEGCYVDEAKGEVADVIGRVQESCQRERTCVDIAREWQEWRRKNA